MWRAEDADSDDIGPSRPWCCGCPGSTPRFGCLVSVGEQCGEGGYGVTFGCAVRPPSTVLGVAAVRIPAVVGPEADLDPFGFGGPAVAPDAQCGRVAVGSPVLK